MDYRNQTGGLKTPRRRERGMALVFVLLGLTLLSMLAASLMFVSSAGSFASLSFKNQMQATYAAGAGEQMALNWFRTTYTAWLDTHADPGYNTSGSTPTYNGAAVTLGSGANFPDSTIAGSFAGVASGSLTMGNASTSYAMTATLLTHDAFQSMTGGQVGIERWQLDVTGTVNGTLGNSTVQERAVFERFFSPTFKDAIRGQCNVLLGGNITTDSFISANGVYGGGNVYTGASAQASVGSNTFIQDTGNAGTINGNAYYGTAVGSCTCPTTPCEQFNHPNVVQGQIVQAPGVPFPPVPAWDTTNGSTNDCSGNSDRYFAANNTGSPVFPSTEAGHRHSCNPGGSATITLCVDSPGTGTTDNTGSFFFNSLTLSGSQNLQIKHLGPGGACNDTATNCSSTNSCADVRLYVNQGLSLGGGGVIGVNPGDPTKFSAIYSGTADATYTGNSDFVGTIYAPNATLNLKGGAVVYGAVSAKNVTDTGNVTVHYDLTLQSKSGVSTPFRLINQTRRLF